MPLNHDDNNWHLDKKVPLALLAFFVVQTLTFAVMGTSWKSDTDHRIVALEKAEELRAPQGGQIQALQLKFDFISGTLIRIEGTLKDLEKKTP